MNNKIGNFFASIGRGIKRGFFGLINWVKNTAWIQPLLIVGVIFGVILCIKPVTSWIGGLFNPDETYAFYREHNSDIDTVYDRYIKTNEGTAILFFYGDDSTASADAEKSIINFNAANPSVDWYCIDVDSDDTTLDENGKTKDEILLEKFQYNFFDEYAAKYATLPSSMKSSDYPDELTLSDDDGSNAKIPTPLMARYDNGELIGVKVGISTSNASKDLNNFILGDPADWINFTI